MTHATIDKYVLKPVRIKKLFESLLSCAHRLRAERQLEAQLKQSHSLLMALSRQIPGMLYQFRIFPDGTSCMPYSSDAIKDIYGITPEQVQEDATVLFSVLHPEDYDAVIDSTSESAETLRPWVHEFRIIPAQRGVRWLSGRAQPEQMRDGSILWHGFICDITDQKEITNAVAVTSDSEQ